MSHCLNLPASTLVLFQIFTFGKNFKMSPWVNLDLWNHLFTQNLVSSMKKNLSFLLITVLLGHKNRFAPHIFLLFSDNSYSNEKTLWPNFKLKNLRWWFCRQFSKVSDDIYALEFWTDCGVVNAPALFGHK